jgi:hypothetical protein
MLFRQRWAGLDSAGNFTPAPEKLIPKFGGEHSATSNFPALIRLRPPFAKSTRKMGHPGYGLRKVVWFRAKWITVGHPALIPGEQKPQSVCVTILAVARVSPPCIDKRRWHENVSGARLSRVGESSRFPRQRHSGRDQHSDPRRGDGLTLWL